MKTGKNNVGQWYGNVLNISSLSTAEEFGAVSGTSYSDISNSWNESLNDYVNPSGKFKARVIKDNSNVVRGLIFTQTTVSP
ncbi:hypothetical protein D3C81_2114620 [compost metagenome]